MRTEVLVHGAHHLEHHRRLRSNALTRKRGGTEELRKPGYLRIADRDEHTAEFTLVKMLQYKCNGRWPSRPRRGGLHSQPNAECVSLLKKSSQNLQAYLEA